MRFISTRGKSSPATFRQALFHGQAPDGGLYVPVCFPTLSSQDWTGRLEVSYAEFCADIAERILAPEIPAVELRQILETAYTFQPTLTSLDPSTFCLELYHGPTLSFKDFGARFMARCMGYFVAGQSQELTILVATSGDTGSAVANAFHRVPGIRIVLLYPSGQVSPLQEKQFTTLGDNIVALEVAGSFDDCQSMVKQAFLDPDLRRKLSLSSANSINIGRLLPQSFYYFWCLSRLSAQDFKEVVVCVPSGNFGNLCAGLYAEKMGLKVGLFIAAVNRNAVIPAFLATGSFQPAKSVTTLSNAMDVGNPSNWERIRNLFRDDLESIRRRIWSVSIQDVETITSMQRSYHDWAYLMDPHTAVGMEALRVFRKKSGKYDPAVVFSTAHPAKFTEIIKQALGFEPDLPESLAQAQSKSKSTVWLPKKFAIFKDFLMNLGN